MTIPTDRKELHVSAESKSASLYTAAANQDLYSQLKFEDRSAFEDAQRGFIATLEPPVIRNDEGQIVWDLTAYDFLNSEAPESVNPSLWRMAQLNRIHGLFQVCERVYQVRGFDLSNMTIIEGDRGYVVVDPLLTVETAAAAMSLVREQLGDKPVTAVIISHCHGDHYGGLKGVVTAEQVSSGEVPIVAPIGFMEHAISENVYAGNAMSRRADYMYGGVLTPGAQGQVSCGLGMGLSRGTVSLLEPTRLITETGEEHELDGIRFEFHYTPGTEAPAEMNFYLPDLRALCMAENVTHHMHNLYTLRGAEVRDAVAWSDYIQQALELFGDRTDVMFISHHWPVWGREEIRSLLERQRDMYRYIHDETLRLAAHGYTMVEIAERIALPKSLGTSWTTRGYYGSLNHNVKAVYQKYLGWFDGNPARLHPHEPVEAASRYVEFMGGAESLLEKARKSYAAGDYRWVAEVVGHAVFADPDNRAARELQADAFEQLGYQAESAPWRNFYLGGARELREGVTQAAPGTTSVTRDVVEAMTSQMLLDYVAIRLNGPTAAQHAFSVMFVVTDTDEEWIVTLSNGVLLRHRRSEPEEVDATVRLSRPTLASLALGIDAPESAQAAARIAISGDEAVVHQLFAMCDSFPPAFAIVTP